MDPVTLIVAAVAAGAAAGVTQVATQVVTDAYQAFKSLLTCKFEAIEAEVVGVERDPEEPLRRDLLAKELIKLDAGEDLEVRAAAEELLRVIAYQAPTAVEAVGMELTRAAVDGDLEITDLAVTGGSGFRGTDLSVKGSIKFSGGRIGRHNADPSTARG
ncbi:hypothetical protein [Nocardia jiangsuensis]|uniref:Uncharacterized protein n=1 Tax=Nocardia jiangsuensis TaxID=1691563 RepID=A0ABV8DTB0_9NOCA